MAKSHALRRARILLASSRMSRAPQFVPPGTLVEITARTNAGRFHLRPSPELNKRIVAILGRAMALYPVMLHAIAVLSNHMHIYVTPLDALALSSFKRHVKGNIAKAAQRINGVQGKVWGKTAVIPILDEEAQLGRLRYALAHGTKEHLVASPLLWPGVTCARVLAGEEKLVGEWIDHVARRRLYAKSRHVHRGAYTTYYPIVFTPFPVQERMTEAQRQQEVRDMLRDIELEHAGPHLGVEAVLAQSPEAEPKDPKLGSAPDVHTTSDVLRTAFRAMKNQHLAAYRAAAAVHAEKPTCASWPFDGFLPAWTFVRGGQAPPLLGMLT